MNNFDLHLGSLGWRPCELLIVQCEAFVGTDWALLGIMMIPTTPVCQYSALPWMLPSCSLRTSAATVTGAAPPSSRVLGAFER